MAKKQVPRKKIPKGAKKKFFEVEIPLTASKVHLYGYSPEYFENNVIKLDLSKSLRGKNLELKARVKLEGEKLTSEIISLNLNKNYLKKVMRKGTDYVEDSIKTNCKDAQIQIKPFMITRMRVSRAVKKAIREQARKFIEARTTTRNTKEILNEVMSNKFQKELSLKVKKVYPLGLCEIRNIEILQKITPTASEKKAETPKKTKSSKETPETPTPSSE